jgi:hypothetical protein
MRCWRPPQVCASPLHVHSCPVQPCHTAPTLTCSVLRTTVRESLQWVNKAVIVLLQAPARPCHCCAPRWPGSSARRCALRRGWRPQGPLAEWMNSRAATMRARSSRVVSMPGSRWADCVRALPLRAPLAAAVCAGARHTDNAAVAWRHALHWHCMRAFFGGFPWQGAGLMQEPAIQRLGSMGSLQSHANGANTSRDPKTARAKCCCRISR